MLRTKLPGLDLERLAIQFLRLGLTLLVIENQPQAPHGRQRAGMLRPEHSALDLKRNRHTIFPLRCNGAVAADWRPDYSSLPTDRKSTRLNSSHLVISYAVFCLKKKK